MKHLNVAPWISVVLMLSAGLILFQMLILAIDLGSKPEGARWVGAHLVNTNDVAVYQAHLRQSAEASLIYSPYVLEPNTSRIDPFWFMGSVLVRTGLSPAWANLVLRFFMTVILAVSIVLTARWLRPQRIASTTLFLTSGLTTGWVVWVWYGFRQVPLTPQTSPLDALEASVPFSLLGGAHMVLSFALLLLAMRWVWQAIRAPNFGRIFAAACTMLALSSFHPYFIPLLAVMILISILQSISLQTVKRLLGVGAALTAALLPATLYYGSLWLRPSVFGQHPIVVQVLTLPDLPIWIVTFLPILGALIWMRLKRIPLDSEFAPWAIAWLLSVLVCALALPWRFKLLQGLSIPLVVLTLPVWDRIWDELRQQGQRILIPYAVLFLLFPFAVFVVQELRVSTDSILQQRLFLPQRVFVAWSWIDQQPRKGFVLSTNPVINLWTPAATRHPVWIGHPHETPDFAYRWEGWSSWMQQEDASAYLEFLDTHQITLLLLDTEAEQQRAKSYLSADWDLVFEDKGVQVWKRSSDPPSG
ncbi:hypothetical protein GF380_05330 [Candidatus Uhrbacteria bacterium]|nr:hypothetical protein [Candidatus Uhrbacteria bacterium]MBD3284452.1 hypothetical protein [Candidatus Uhrbacteria bacterium]